MNLILVKREGLGMQWGNTVYPEERGHPGGEKEAKYDLL